MEETKKVTIHIAGRNYPLIVTKDESSYITDIEKEISLRINDFQVRYAERDKQDVIAMALITYAMEGRKNGISDKGNVDLKSLSNIESILDSIS